MTGERIHSSQLHTLRDDAPEVLLEASMDVASGTYPSGSFAYDANGNLTRDMSRDITDMEYNALNLPCRATFADGSEIDWLYTASGEKLRQTVIAATGDTLSRRDYLGPYLFTDNEFDRYETAEGYITPDNIYHAYIPDYQGNIVGVVNTCSGILEQHTRYYPYGLPFADASTPTANRRKYGAKELTPDLGLNAYDFEARMLFPAFPIFSQQDSHAEKYHPLSPYLYCAGNPINFIDPTGMKFTEESEKHINRLTAEINRLQAKNDKKIAKIEAEKSKKGLSQKKLKKLDEKISKLKSKNNSLEEVRTEIKILKNSTQTYNVEQDNSLNVPSKYLGDGGETRYGAKYNFKTGMFDIILGDTSIGLLAHELKHAYQFETGALSTASTPDTGSTFYDKTDEAEAFARRELFGGPMGFSSIYSLPDYYKNLPDGPISVDGLEDITKDRPSELQKIANRGKCAFHWKDRTYSVKTQ